MGRPYTCPATVAATYCVPATVNNRLICAINYYLLISHRTDYTRVPVATIPATGCTTCGSWSCPLLLVVPRRSLGVLPYTATGACTPARYSSTSPPARLSFPRGGSGTELYYTVLLDAILPSCLEGVVPTNAIGGASWNKNFRCGGRITLTWRSRNVVPRIQARND